MRCLWTALAVMALSSAATADECNIIWLDIFLPRPEVEFEKTSEASALLTLKDTAKPEPIRFELATTTLTRDDGTELNLLLGKQTLVAERLSNQVTLTLQPKGNSWLINFDSEQTLRTKRGRSFGGETNLAGYLVCNQLRPWALDSEG